MDGFFWHGNAFKNENISNIQFNANAVIYTFYAVSLLSIKSSV